jgi:site-specific DNA recombinase
MTKRELIKASIQASFETGASKIADKVCYGYSKASDGSLTINEEEAQIVRLIFDRYLSGGSLGKIVGCFLQVKIPHFYKGFSPGTGGEFLC